MYKPALTLLHAVVNKQPDRLACCSWPRGCSSSAFFSDKRRKKVREIFTITLKDTLNKLVGCTFL